MFSHGSGKTASRITLPRRREPVTCVRCLPLYALLKFYFTPRLVPPVIREIRNVNTTRVRRNRHGCVVVQYTINIFLFLFFFLYAFTAVFFFFFYFFSNETYWITLEYSFFIPQTRHFRLSIVYIYYIIIIYTYFDNTVIFYFFSSKFHI